VVGDIEKAPKFGSNASYMLRDNISSAPALVGVRTPEISRSDVLEKLALGKGAKGGGSSSLQHDQAGM
jgi:hypothetical protein